ncbi:MAG: FCD domain-containing protein [Cypionkella sp.]
MAELAMPALTPALIEQLEAIDVAVDAAIRDDDLHAYLQNNHAFHFALYEAAGPGVLLDMARSLWLRFGPSLRVVSGRSGALTLPDGHKEALAAMRAGNASALAEACDMISPKALGWCGRLWREGRSRCRSLALARSSRWPLGCAAVTPDDMRREFHRQPQRRERISLLGLS